MRVCSSHLLCFSLFRICMHGYLEGCRERVDAVAGGSEGVGGEKTVGSDSVEDHAGKNRAMRERRLRERVIFSVCESMLTSSSPPFACSVARRS